MVTPTKPWPNTRAPILWSRISVWRTRLAVDARIREGLSRNGFPVDGSIDSLLLEYLRFHYLDMRMKEGAVPSPDVKAVLDVHRADAGEYAAFLEDLLGAPGKDVDAEGTPANYEKTLEAYRREFGEPDATFWPPHNLGKAFAIPWRMTPGGRRAVMWGYLAGSVALGGVAALSILALPLLATVAVPACVVLLFQFGHAWDAIHSTDAPLGRAGNGWSASDYGSYGG